MKKQWVFLSFCLILLLNVQMLFAQKVVGTCVIADQGVILGCTKVNGANIFTCTFNPATKVYTIKVPTVSPLTTQTHSVMITPEFAVNFQNDRIASYNLRTMPAGTEIDVRIFDISDQKLVSNYFSFTLISYQ